MRDGRTHQGNEYIASAESHSSGEAVAVNLPDGKKVVAMIHGVPRNGEGLSFGEKDGRTLSIAGASVPSRLNIRVAAFARTRGRRLSQARVLANAATIEPEEQAWTRH